MTNDTSSAVQKAVELVNDLARAARVASRQLRTATTGEKDELLRAIAEALESNVARIVNANERDLTRGRENGMSEGLLDRLALTAERVLAIADAVRTVVALPDPVGEVVTGATLDNGLRLIQKRVPMGVIGMIYEARPNVTVDAAVLALKAGSAVLLRGGSAARYSNEVLVSTMREAIAASGFSADLVASVDSCGRPGAVALMRARGLVDLVIPRGGASLIQTVVREALVPVIETGVGNVHVYVDKYANLDDALAIILNAKTQRVGVCNAAETLLVHAGVADEFLPRALQALKEKGVTIHGDEQSAKYATGVVPATTEDWGTEYLSLDLAVKVVADVDEAITHISTYSTGHTEAIVSDHAPTIEYFVANIDAAALMVNASTRFTDGGEFGFGAEIGISTQKLHARGPMGLRELTTTTWIVTGDGHVRG